MKVGLPCLLRCLRHSTPGHKAAAGPFRKRRKFLLFSSKLGAYLRCCTLLWAAFRWRVKEAQHGVFRSASSMRTDIGPLRERRSKFGPFASGSSVCVSKLFVVAACRIIQKIHRGCEQGIRQLGSTSQHTYFPNSTLNSFLFSDDEATDETWFRTNKHNTTTYVNTRSALSRSAGVIHAEAETNC